ncbi:hypothetical protein OPV22_007688 [Ensete ventricosum]|uniref:U-box domain-containing protein n=1 Tax=Ensete ventricosum TaxID=4639 RepID=A0AAV8Q7T2_ENSVE|nr:hypothetical protein OPV22_007688 [Ensete ventricosum]
MEPLEIPSYFLCPISLEIMRDPVTLPTGITFDRDSIERWILDGKHSACPVTRQPLPDCELTPNHTLRRLIQAWCALHSPSGAELVPTPRTPVGKRQIAELLEAAMAPQSRLASLRKLKAVVSERHRNKRYVETTPGTLEISQEGLLDLLAKNANIIESLTTILRRSNGQSRSYATLLLRSLLGVISPARSIGLHAELFQEIVNVLRDRISHQATKAALHALVRLCPWGTNRTKSVEAGAVHVLVELLLEEPERRVTELGLAALDRLCRCGEGRAALVRHGAAIPAVSKKILRVSQLASEKAARIVRAVARHSPAAELLEEMLQLGVVTKLCLVLRYGCGGKTEEKARQILRLHSRVWMHSPCLHPHLRLSYPTL